MSPNVIGGTMKHARFVNLGLAFLALAVIIPAAAQSEKGKTFDGLGLGLSNLSRLSKAQTRSISPENFTGEKGQAAMSTDGPAAKAARDLGQGSVSYTHLTLPTNRE